MKVNSSNNQQQQEQEIRLMADVEMQDLPLPLIAAANAATAASNNTGTDEDGPGPGTGTGTTTVVFVPVGGTATKDELDSLPSSLRFNYFDMFCIVFSILTYLFDLGMDIFIATIYYYNNAIVYFILTLIFVIVPSVTMTAFSLRWYVMDLDAADHQQQQQDDAMSCSHKPSYKKWVVRITFLLLQMAPVLRYVDSLMFGLKSRKAKSNGNKSLQIQYYSKMVNEDSDATLLRLFEAFMEAAPQVTLQLYIFSVHFNDAEGGPLGGRGHIVQVIAILSSLVSLAWSMSSYQRSLRFAQADKGNITYKGTILQFIWHFCEIGSRILSIGMFASCYAIFISPFCAVHWFVMLCWLIYQEKQSWPNRCEELLFYFVVSFVYIFTFFNVRDEQTRYKYLFYYAIYFIENTLLISAWFFTCAGNGPNSSSIPVPGFGLTGQAAAAAEETEEDQDQQIIRLLVLIGQFSLFLVSMLAMCLYYKYFHPPSPQTPITMTAGDLMMIRRRNTTGRSQSMSKSASSFDQEIQILELRKTQLLRRRASADQTTTNSSQNPPPQPQQQLVIRSGINQQQPIST